MHEDSFWVRSIRMCIDCHCWNQLLVAEKAMGFLAYNNIEDMNRSALPSVNTRRSWNRTSQVGLSFNVSLKVQSLSAENSHIGGVFGFVSKDNHEWAYDGLKTHGFNKCVFFNILHGLHGGHRFGLQSWRSQYTAVKWLWIYVTSYVLSDSLVAN